MTPRPSRRRFLASGGAFVALPAFESLGFRRSAAAATPAAPPKRLIFLGFGYGVTEDFWYPRIDQPGAGYDLPPGLQPLARHKADFSVVQGFWNKFANEGHWGSTMWLTGANRYAEPGQNFHNSVSADQVAAAHIGRDCRFASLQLSGGQGTESSGHGPGLSMAWDVRGRPVGGQNGPLELYHRLFSRESTPIEQQRAALAQKRSVLDAVLDNAHGLKRGLNKTDTAKLDEYFQGIRDIETRLSKDEQWIGVPQPKAPFGEPKPGLAGRDEIQVAYDLFIAALRTDSTRVLTYRLPINALLTSLGLKVHSHDMSHYHGTLGEKLEASQTRDLALSEMLAGFIDKLKATKEADGTRLFDHTCLVYGSNIRTGHELTNCPTVVAGGGAGLKLGQNIVVPKGTPLCNLWLTLLNRLGVDAERHGDSTGLVKEVIA